MRPPRPSNEAARLLDLRRCGLLDTAPSPPYDDIVSLASQLTGSEIALVSLIDSERQWFKARVGLDAQETDRRHAFCAHAIMSTDPFQVDDARRDERFRDNPLVTGPPHIRRYVGIPILSPRGFVLGTLCVIDSKPGRLRPSQLRGLKALARQVETLLQLDEKRSQAESATLAKSPVHGRFRGQFRGLRGVGGGGFRFT